MDKFLGLSGKIPVTHISGIVTSVKRKKGYLELELEKDTDTYRIPEPSEKPFDVMPKDQVHIYLNSPISVVGFLVLDEKGEVKPPMYIHHNYTPY